MKESDGESRRKRLTGTCGGTDKKPAPSQEGGLFVHLLGLEDL